MSEFIIRSGKESDVAELIDLWNICFDDTEDFVFFFFNNRFFPNYCVCVTYEEKIVAAMYSMPIEQWIRKAKIKSAIIAGVGTHPDFRGKGLMKKMFLFLMPLLKNKGISSVTYHPVNFNIYKSLGHLSTSTSLNLKIPAGSLLEEIFRVKDLESLDKNLKNLSFENLSELFNLYSEFAPCYSGMIARTLDDFLLKIKDYIASKANILLLEEKGILSGYCIYFKTPNEVLGEEIICFSEKSLTSLISVITKMYPKDNITLRLASDKQIVLPKKMQKNFNILDKNVTGVTNICLFLKQLNLNRFLSDEECDTYSIKVNDSFLKENNVIVNLNGDICKGVPKLTLNIGELTRFLCGFLPASDVLNPTLNISKRIIQTLDSKNNRLPCWIVDEY